MFRTCGWKLGWILVVAIAGATVSGCAESSTTRRARITREQAFNRDIDAITSLEKRRPEKLAGTANVIQQRFEHDQEATREDARILNDWLPNETREWNRKQPDYEKAIKHHIEGHPDEIEQTAPYFIY